MKKVRSWWLVVLCTIGLCWGWLCHEAILAKLTPTNLPITLMVSAVNESSGGSFQNVNYHPNGEWIGRLILPSQEQVKKLTLTDWVWVEIKHAPASDRELIDKKVRLTWQPQSKIAADVRQVTTDIKFTTGTIDRGASQSCDWYSCTCNRRHTQSE